MIYESDLAKKEEEKEKKEDEKEHYEEEETFFFHSTGSSDFSDEGDDDSDSDLSRQSDTQNFERIKYKPIDVSFFGNKCGQIVEQPCFVNGRIDWCGLLQLEEPMLIVLKLTYHLNNKESSSILVKDWDDLIPLSDILISVSKCKLIYHKKSIILEMLSTEVLEVIINLISETLATIPSQEKLTVVNKLICFKEDVILYFDHLLAQVDTTTLKSLLQMYVRFYENALINIGLDIDTLDKLCVIIEKVNSRNFNSFNLCFPTNIHKKNEVYANLKVGAYKSVTDYVTTHFLLLKEDFESVLRTGIRDYLTKKNCGPTEKSLNIYKNVRLSMMSDSCVVKFTDEQNKQFKQVDWRHSKMFIYGSLILLTTNHFKTYFLAKVINRKSLKHGKGMLIISFLLVPDHIDFDALYTLAEPSKYFEPSCSVMKILRQMPKYTFPFEKYLVHAVSDVKPPSYLHEGTSYNIGEHSVIVSKRDTYPDPKTVGLNSNQMDSLFHALNHELCLIQGPPGTGKTFMCRQIVKVLLQNKHVWANRFNTPILIICYKNLSLDELLIGLLKDKVRILRIGRRTKSKALAKYYSLRTIQRPEFCDIFQQYKKDLNNSLHYVGMKRYTLFKTISMITENKGLIPFVILKPVLNSEEAEYLRCIYLDWIFDMPVKDIKTSSFKQHSTYAITEQDVRVFKSKLINSPTADDKSTYFQNNNLNFKDLDKLCSRLKKFLKFKLNTEETKKTELLNANVKDITNVEDRWALYYLWLEKLKSMSYSSIKNLTEKQSNLDGQLHEINGILNSRKIGQNTVDVVGMTTTAGARLNVLLDELKPRIVIIEEAAEIIESHCVASLNEHCQHVILFGDHKQLRPCVDSKEFATKYNFDLSLFERLINNGIDPSVLNIQYRMRPEISALIAPAIYKFLQNDESVTNRDNIKGVGKNVYFVDHSHHESKGSTSSIYNDFEVHFSLGLAHYFIMQGYEPHEITILTMYKEQENMLQKNKEKFKNLNDIIIATVDSYQGKENTIIILSLVRNNKQGHVGFLTLDNRVCVALSRARVGFFILGNMTILSKSSTLWQEVQTVLQKQNAIGNSLPLICQKKLHNIEAVSYNQLLVSSNTGCDEMCKQELKCGHVCKSNCHVQDTEHEEIYLCTEFCKITLECGHKCQFMCHTDDKQHEDKFSCPLHNNNSVEELDNLLSRFSVTINPNMKQNIKNKSKRGELCGAKLSCGHRCLFQCQLFEDGKHQNYLACKTICGKVLKCGHKCTNYCHKKSANKKANKHSCPTKCANKS